MSVSLAFSNRISQDYYHFGFYVNGDLVETYGGYYLDPTVMSANYGTRHYSDVMEHYDFDAMESLAAAETSYQESLHQESNSIW